MNVEIVAEAAQFPEKEYINGIAVAVQRTIEPWRLFLEPWRVCRPVLQSWNQIDQDPDPHIKNLYVVLNLCKKSDLDPDNIYTRSNWIHINVIWIRNARQLCCVSVSGFFLWRIYMFPNISLMAMYCIARGNKFLIFSSPCLQNKLSAQHGLKGPLSNL